MKIGFKLYMASDLFLQSLDHGRRRTGTAQPSIQSDGFGGHTADNATGQDRRIGPIAQ